MIVECSVCYAKYAVDRDNVSSRGRYVRCSKCGNQWLYKPSKNIIVAESSVAHRTFNKFYSNFFIIFLSCATLLICSMFYYDKIMISVYSLFYKSSIVNSFLINDARGLKFNHIVITKNQQDNRNNIIIQGKIVNTSNNNKAMPYFKIVLRDELDKALSVYKVKSSGKIVLPNKQEHFLYQIIDVPNNVKKVVVDMGSRLDLILR